MCYRTNMIWEKLLNDKFIDVQYPPYDLDLDLVNKSFIIKICENDIKYIQMNYQIIIDPRIQNDCFLVAITQCNDYLIIDFISEKFKINYKSTNIQPFDLSENNILILACAHNHEINIIKHLIENYKIDIKYKNNEGSNCLHMACLYNDNIEIIKYLIEISLMDPNQTDDEGNNCLILASRNKKSSNQNIFQIIKYLVEMCKVNVHHTNNEGVNCLIQGCHNLSDVEIIKYFIEKCNININHENINKYNCLAAACMMNSNLNIVHYLINKFEYLENRNEYLLMACQKNSNENIIKYLIQECDMDINYKHLDGADCLYFACAKNNNPKIIEYLVCEKKMDISNYYINNNICLIYACTHNKNLNIIKYLIEGLKIDTSHFNKFEQNCLFCACYFNENLEISKYLIECTEIKMMINNLSLDRFIKIIPMIKKNYHRFNEFIKHGIKKYGLDLKEVITKINPLMLNENNSRTFMIKSHEEPYEKFKTYVEQLTCSIPLPDKTLVKKIQKKRILVDYRKPTSVLFRHNGNIYYGSREIVYDNIILLNDMDDFDFSECIELVVDAPQYIIFQYIQSSYNQTFDINIILKDHFLNFLNLIDKYPTNILSVCLFEIDLILYMHHEKIQSNEFLMNICNKYKLKYLYLFLKNKYL